MDYLITSDLIRILDKIGLTRDPEATHWEWGGAVDFSDGDIGRLCDILIRSNYEKI